MPFNKKIELTGQRFGRLVVLGDSGKRSTYGHVAWLCLCDCGKRVRVLSGNLRYGQTRSCSCLKKELVKTLRKTSIIHGESDKNSRLYTVWINLKRKCYNRNAINYENYGGKKIRVCKEWLDKKIGYISFRTWVLNNGYSPSLRNFVIDRINPKGDYQPDNCRLITRSEATKRAWKERGSVINIQTLTSSTAS